MPRSCISHRRGGVLFCGVIALTLAMVLGSKAWTDGAVDIDASDLRAAQGLSDLPPDLLVELREHGLDRGISDLGHAAGASAPRSATAWYLVGGASDSRGLVAIQYVTGRENERFHAKSFCKLNGHWTAVTEWIIPSQPHTLDELAALLRAPETTLLTAKWQDRLRVSNLEDRIYKLEPGRKYLAGGPLREVDINDEEVREIQGVVQELLPGSIVLISGVSKGCPCEEGPNCSAQVWTAIHLPNRTKSLELSQVGSHWTVGAVQRWYLESEDLKRTHFASYAEYTAAQTALEGRFPLCASSGLAR